MASPFTPATIPSGGGAAGVSASTLIQTRAGSPVGALTPTAIGSLCQDLTNGGVYVALGATSASWVCVGGYSPNADALVAGVAVNAGASGYNALLADGNATAAVLSDVDALSNTGTFNGVSWLAGAADGQQGLAVQVGSTGQFNHTFLASGVVSLAGKLNVLDVPVADPHVVGQVYQIAGTLHVSAG